MKTFEKWWFWLGCSILLYANTLNHEYTIDDLIVVTSNKMTQKGISEIPEIFKHSYLYGYDGREDESYRPLTLSTFAIEKSLFNANSGASHLIQVLLYGLCVLVLFRFLQNLLGQEKHRITIAIVLLFMLHPIHTEVVANVKSRDELLSALFLFSSLWLYSNWILTEKKTQLVLSLLLFFAATLSKETAVLGVVLFPATYYFIKSVSILEIVKKSVLFSIPFFVYFALRSMVLSDVLIQDPIDPVANSLALAQSSGEMFTSNLSIFAKYIQLTIFPLHMSWDYSIATFPLVSFGTFGSSLGIVFLMIILGVLVFGLLKKKLIGFAALIFVSTFALTSNFFFLINCTLGERFLFIPVLGIIMLVVVIVHHFLKDRSTNFPFYILLAFVVFFTGRTISRNLDWKNNLSIYEAGVKVSPNSVKAHFNLGTEYLEIGNSAVLKTIKNDWFEKSIAEFHVAKDIYPKYVNIYENMGFVYAELGKAASDRVVSIDYYRKGLTELGIAIDSLKLSKPSLFQNKYFILEQLIELSDDQTEKQDLMLDMVNTVEMKKSRSAEDFQREIYYLRLLKEYEKLVKIAKELLIAYPDKKDYILVLSQEFFEKRQYNQSFELMAAYVKQFPNDLSAKSNMGMLLEILGRKKEALKIYEEILAVDPNQLHTKELYDILKRTM